MTTSGTAGQTAIEAAEATKEAKAEAATMVDWSSFFEAAMEADGGGVVAAAGNRTEWQSRM